MKKEILTTLACCSTALFAQFVNAESKPDKLSVAYFLEWPTANQTAQIEKTYDKELGVEVEWLPFDSGAAMTAAMASGDVDISYSQGLVPFVVAVSQGLPIKTVGVAVSYSENDNCVVSTKSGINQSSAKKLEGERIAVPFGTVSHYKMLKVLEYLDVDISKVIMLDMVPSDGAAALSTNAVTMACGWGGSLARMKKYGEVLMSPHDQEAIGIRTLDVISVSNRFADKYPELLTKFLQVTDDANRAYTNDPASAVPVIAKASGLEMTDAESILGRFDFPLKEDQISQKWMGGILPTFTKEVADFFVAQNQIPKALNSYADVIDDSYYSQVK